MQNSSTLNLVYKAGADTRSVRVITIDGEPWFVAADIAAILGYSSAKDAARLVRDDERGRHTVPTTSGDQEMTLVSESGLYRLMMKSRRTEAEQFQDWVTREVLPSIRKTGTYVAAPTLERAPTPAQALLQTAQALISLESRTDALEEKTDRLPILGDQVGTIFELGQRLGRTIGNYRKGWHVFKEHFKIAGYRDLPASKFDEAVRFLELQIRAYGGDPS